MPSPKRAAVWPRSVWARASLGLLALVAAAVASHPLWLAPWVERSLAQSSGRSVAFDSLRVGLTPDLDPVLRCYGVRVANAAWAEARGKPFAAIGEFSAVLSWRSLFETQRVVRLMVLRDGEVDLERQADGLRNWRLRNPEDRGPGRYKVLALQAERATVRFRHGGIGLDVEAKARPNDAAEASMPTRIELAGAWRALPFDASVATGAVLTFLETGTTFPLSGRLRAGGAELSLQGRAGDIFRAPLLDVRTVVAGDALAPFSPFLGPRYEQAPRRAFRIEGQVHAADRRYALTAATVHVGASDFAGEVSIEPAPDAGQRRSLRARVHSQRVDAADLRWLAGPHMAEAAEAAGATVRAARSPAPSASDADARPAFARRFDAAIGFEAQQLRVAEAAWLKSVKLDATLDDGRLVVPAFELGVLQGRATGKLVADLRPSLPSADLELALGGVRIESLLHEPAGQARVTGLLKVDGHLRASGHSAEAMLASASGRVHASLGGGTLSSLLDAEIGLQGGKIVRSLLGGSEPIPIRCAALAIDVHEGAGRLRSLVLDTARTRTTGSGSIDLHRQTLDVLLTPEAKQGGLFVLERSIRLHGPIRKPARELVARAEAPAAANASVCPA